MKVYNKLKQIAETVKKEACPRCKGYGTTITDARNGNGCQLCKGHVVLCGGQRLGAAGQGPSIQN